MQPPVHQGAHICGFFINLRSPRTNKICIDHICSTRFISFVNHVLIVLGMFTRFLSFIDDNIYRGPFLLVCIYCRNTLYVTAWFLRNFVSLPLYWSDECNSCLISACMYAAYKHVFLFIRVVYMLSWCWYVLLLWYNHICAIFSNRWSISLFFAVAIILATAGLALLLSLSKKWKSISNHNWTKQHNSSIS